MESLKIRKSLKQNERYAGYLKRRLGTEKLETDLMLEKSLRHGVRM